MEKQFVRNLKAGDTVDSEFLVSEKSLVPFTQPNRSGQQFLRLQVSDITGSIGAVVWENGLEVAGKLVVGDVVRIQGTVSDYRGLQLVVHRVERLIADQVSLHMFRRVAPRDHKEMLAELKGLQDEISDPYLLQLIRAFFNDADFFHLYVHAPAARSIHHNYIGGLLEHSLEVADFCRSFIQLYPVLDRSLLLCGALLHDVGKIEEYDTGSLNFELTTRGKLLGHIAIGKEMLEDRVKRIADFPERLHLELAHMLLSHHGKREWGSPEVPKTFPAFALFHADFISARLNQFAQLANRGNCSKGWTEWDRSLDRSIFLGLAE